VSSRLRSRELTLHPLALVLPSQYVKQETIEDTPQGRVARATRQISERASTRIGRMAFEIALAAAQVKQQRGTAFRESVRKVAAEYPNVEVNEQIVDSLVYRCVAPLPLLFLPLPPLHLDLTAPLCARSLFREPEKLSTLVCPNLYGDIVS